jgi:hypothetical protein
MQIFLLLTLIALHKETWYIGLATDLIMVYWARQLPKMLCCQDVRLFQNLGIVEVSILLEDFQIGIGNFNFASLFLLFLLFFFFDFFFDFLFLNLYQMNRYT